MRPDPSRRDSRDFHKRCDGGVACEAGDVAKPWIKGAGLRV